MKILSTKSINLYGSYDDGVRSRRIWQQLFDIYREHGDLSNMDNMLIDYDNCLKFVKDQRKSGSRHNSFVLGFDFDRGDTWWYSGERFDKEYALVATHFDHYIEVNIDGDEVEFIHHIQEN